MESTVSVPDEYTDELWVEKFAPRAFCDLLSDIVRISSNIFFSRIHFWFISKGINRTLLEWLNLWQYCKLDINSKPMKK